MTDTHNNPTSLNSLSDFPFIVGIATVDITPPVGVTLIGYLPRISTRIDTPLRAECLFCAADEPKQADGRSGQWLLISGEFIGMRRDRSDELRRRIASATGVPVDSILITATHTHSGPRTMGFDPDQHSGADTEYFAQLLDKLEQLAVRAVANAAPGRFEIRTTQARQWMSNRRVMQPDGSCKNVWQDPDGQHTGYVDPLMSLVTVVRPESKSPELLIVNYGCHPVVLGPASLGVSGDYVAYLKQKLEAQNIAQTTLFLLAPCGDINPRNCITDNPENPKKMGEELAELIAQTIKTVDPCPVGAGQSRQTGSVGGASIEWNIIRTWDAMKMSNTPNNKAGDTLCTLMTAVSAGDLGLVGLPGEPFSEFSRIIREKSPFAHTLIAAMAQDYPGYFPTDQGQIDGGYEAKMAPADRIEQDLIGHASAVLKQAKSSR